MRGDQWDEQGEVGRVAARVRELIAGEDLVGGDGFGDEPPGAGERDLDVPAGRSHRPLSLWQRVTARLPVRVDPGRRGALAVGVAVLVAAVVTGLWLMSTRPRAVAVSAAVPSVPGSSPLVGTTLPDTLTGAAAEPIAGGPSSSPAAVVSSSATAVVVDVAGKVRHPGLYHLPAGSRVDDAIRAAGGARAGVDLSSLNLAAKLVDGQQIAVGVRGLAGGGLTGGSVAGAAVASASDAGGAPGATSQAPVDLNIAGIDQLETLPGVGPVLGQHILDYRTEHGSFTSVDQLQDVSGIGDVKFAALRPLVTI